MTRRFVVTLAGLCFLILASDTALQCPMSAAHSDRLADLGQYRYPNAKLLKDLLKESTGLTLSGPSHCVIYTSSDDFPTVCKWYKERCDFSSKEVFHAHAAYGSVAALLEDSTEQKERRPVSVLALCDYNCLKRHLVMVVVSRGDKESRTHILLSISQLPTSRDAR